MADGEEAKEFNEGQYVDRGVVMSGGKLDLDKVKMGMVVCFKSDGSFISNRIEAYQKYIGFDVESSKIVHVAVSMGGPFIIEATWPRSRTSNLLEDHQGREYEFLYLRDPEFRLCKRKNVTVWAASRCNLDYGWRALLGFYLQAVLPIFGSNPLHVKRNPFCSYLVAWAFRRVGYDLWPGTSTDMITPAAICSISEFEKMDCTKDD